MTTPPSKPCPSKTNNVARNFFLGAVCEKFFVLFFLAMAIATVARFAPAQDAATTKAVDPREQAVRQLIDRYFLTWSKQDIDRYGQCFLPQAIVQLFDPQRGLTTIPLGPFLESQREAHRRAAKPLTETAESVDVRFETPDIARVIVYWKLTGNARNEHGYDHFTLLNTDGKWRIANLLFYAVEPEVKK